MRPAAHYLMGGIRTDVHGRSSLAGLYAAGEAACTGVHGANRLASNSLLEGLVFGALAAEAMVETSAQGAACREQQTGSVKQGTRRTMERRCGGVEGWIAELRALMWRDAGLLRDAAGLRGRRRGWQLRATQPLGISRRALEARNLLMVAEAIVQAALGGKRAVGRTSGRIFLSGTVWHGTRWCGRAG